MPPGSTRFLGGMFLNAVGKEFPELLLVYDKVVSRQQRPRVENHKCDFKVYSSSVLNMDDDMSIYISMDKGSIH